jgi:hypothetical protein
VIGPPQPKVNPNSTACPFCGQPMQAGAVIGDRYQLKWLPADRSLTLGIWAAAGEPIGQWAMFKRSQIRGMRCNRCRRIIVGY